VIKLNKISLAGYKSIRECRELRLENLNVLIGANGSGKSNLLSFFKLLNFEMTGALQEFIGRSGGAGSLLHMGAKATPYIEAMLEMASDKGANTYRMRLSHAVPDTLIFTEESIRFSRAGALGNGNPTFLGVGHRESALLQPEFEKNPTAKFFRSALPRFRFYQFHDTSDQSHLRTRSDVQDNRYLYSDGGNIAAFLLSLRNTKSEAYSRIVETVRLVFPAFKDFVLERENGGFVMLRWRAAGAAEHEFGPHQISDGTLRFMALATLLLQPKEWLPNLITIDEPELGLHPYAIKVLASLIQDASNFAQVIIATQSAALVDQFEADDIIVADMQDGASRFERLSGEKLKDWLAEYSLSELWERNFVGGRP
jgi:predicted ATPase